MNFNQLLNLIHEYFVDNAKAYYIDQFGNIIEVIEDSHFEQIVNDYGLDNTSLEDNGYISDEDGYFDADTWDEFVSEFMVDSKIFAIVWDVTNKIVYVRASGQNALNDDQRKAIIDFCISKNSELEYDYKYR
jgi:hypothetical protein